MNISEILERVGVTTEDQKLIEKAVSDLVSESVAAKEVEFKAKYDLISEEFVATQLAEKEAELQTKLNEENAEWRKEFESGIIDKVDQFLDSQIDAKISDALLEDVAYLQIAKPIVESIKRVYEENHIVIDSEGTKIIKEAKEEVESLKEQLSESIATSMENEKLAKVAATKLLIKESVEGLSVEQTERVKTLFEGKDFEEVQAKIGTYVTMLIEEDVKKDTKVDPVDSAEKKVILETDENLVVDAKPKRPSIESMASRFV